MRHLRRRILTWALLPTVLAGAACGVKKPSAPTVLFSGSSSTAPGFYRKVAGPIRRGVIIALRIPAPGRAYAAAHMPERLHTSLLKPVVATGGSIACVRQGHLIVNGRRLGPIFERDGRGRRLPHWRGCLRLAAGEVLLYSDRIPNSFDSRYFGPAQAADVLGVYAPLWIF